MASMSLLTVRAFLRSPAIDGGTFQDQPGFGYSKIQHMTPVLAMSVVVVILTQVITRLS